VLRAKVEREQSHASVNSIAFAAKKPTVFPVVSKNEIVFVNMFKEFVALADDEVNLITFVI
jgi:hypothetical protein